MSSSIGEFGIFFYVASNDFNSRVIVCNMLAVAILYILVMF